MPCFPSGPIGPSVYTVVLHSCLRHTDPQTVELDESKHDMEDLSHDTDDGVLGVLIEEHVQEETLLGVEILDSRHEDE